MESIMGGTEQPFRVSLDQKIPMRDGVLLSADIYTPDWDGSFPVLLLRTIYDNQEARYVRWAGEFLNSGYAVVMQDCRGRFDSDGEWDPYVCEIPDGYDTHEWIGQQSWCDGNIGTFGLSYPGFTQTAPATLGSKYLKALVPIASQQDNYGHHRSDGVIALATSMFFANMMGRTMQSNALSLLDLNALLRRLPLISSLDDIGASGYYRGVIEHEKYDEFWSSYSLRDRYGQVSAPAYFITGWYDSLVHETFKVFNGWRRSAASADAREKSRLLVGPWSHQVAPWGRQSLGPNGEFEELTFGTHAIGDIVEEHLRWYDTRLRELDSGMDDEPPIQLFVMGSNEWRFEHEWPLERTEWTPLYLDRPADITASEMGRLSFEKPESESHNQFMYRPHDPCPSWGGQYQTLDLTGPRDRREIEERPDVLVYETGPLEDDIEVTGPVSARLFASTDVLDTDFTAVLTDVHPDGKAIILCEGICRARFRNGAETPELLTPGETYEFTIDLWDTSNVFLAGHRIRIEISSSNFPRYDRNLNTGGRIGYESLSDARAAQQTIFHGGGMASHVILPVIPKS